MDRRDLAVRVRRGARETDGYVSLDTQAAAFDQGALVVATGRREVILNPVMAALEEVEILSATAEARRLLVNAGYHLRGLWT